MEKEKIKNLLKVDIIASGYEWVCPDCEEPNTEREWTSFVTCRACNNTFETELPEHALGK